MAQSEHLAADPFLTNEYSIEVTLTGESFQFEKATEILGLEPTKVGRKGEPKRKGQCNTVWEADYWSHEINSRDDVNTCRDHHISCLVDQIAPHVEALKAAGMERVYFYFTLSSSIGLLNMKLNPATMKRLADVDADLYISCFDCFDPGHSFWKEEAGAEMADTSS